MSGFDQSFLPIINVILKSAWVWAPILLGYFAHNVWLTYVTREFISQIEWMTLEIKVPREIVKSPMAMELILINAFHQASGPGDFVAKYWKGKVYLWFSLEIVSIEGRVHFIVHIPKKPTDFRNIFESQVYAQFPQAEIREIEDYTTRYGDFTKDSDFNLHGAEFILSKDDYYPIKTYLEYDLNQKAFGAKELDRLIDPINPVVEYMGSMKSGEEMWIQIMIRINPERYDDPEKFLGNRGLDKITQEAIKKLRGEGASNKVLEAIERNAGKLYFDTGIRAIYIAKKDSFKPANITGLMGIFRSFTDKNLNSFKPNNGTSIDFAEWQDPLGNKIIEKKNEMLEAYKMRSYFYWPHNEGPTRKLYALSAEELATIYHFPGKSVETPTFEKLESKRESPPQNLPI